MGMIPHDKQMKLIKDEQARQEHLLVLQKGFQVADVFANRQYLDGFSGAEILNVNSRVVQVPQKLRVFQMSKIAFDKNEDINDKLTSVYNALYNLSVSVALFIVGTSSSVQFYFATRSENVAPLAGQILEATLQSNFPGIRLKALTGTDIDDLLVRLEKNEENRSILKGLSTVSLVPSIRDKEKKEQYVQGMEKFINTLRGKNYTAILLATPLNNADIAIRRHGYEELFST